MTKFQLLLACYTSGQVSERQWQEHLKEADFADWLTSVEGGGAVKTLSVRRQDQGGTASGNISAS